jgi:hypothetical protein
MSSHRATLSAFGTTGVLVAASLTMLAMVSALVTFDAWPRGYGTSSVGTVSVERSPAPHLVRAVGEVAAGTAAHSGAAKGAAIPRAARLRGLGGAGAPRGGGGALGSRSLGAGVRSAPASPYGAGAPGGAPSTSQQRHSTLPGPLNQAACGAQGAVSGLSSGAGGAVGPACGTR